MIAIGARRLFLYAEPIDMRKGIDGLAGIVLGRLLQDPTAGDIFIFMGRRADRLKALCWEKDGYWLCIKRLAEGKFRLPWVARNDGTPMAVELTTTEWQLLLDGIVVQERIVLRRHGRRPAQHPVALAATG